MFDLSEPYYCTYSKIHKALLVPDYSINRI